MDEEWVEDEESDGVIHVATGYRFAYLSDMYEYLDHTEEES